jgi:hypothetical protein
MASAGRALCCEARLAGSPFRRQAGPHLSDVGEHLIKMAVAALRQFMLLKTGHGPEMLADSRKRLGEMYPRRKVFGEYILQIPKQSAGLGIAFEALAVPLALAPLRDAFQGVQTFVDCRSMLVGECCGRQCDRLPTISFLANAPSDAEVRPR